MTTQAEDVYATLLLSDSYLPGALVLAHSLRDAGTKKKLAILVTNDSMTADTMSALQKSYDFIIPVDPIVNQSPANLYLMNRPDLGATFTKIQLWKQTQFRKIVYVDADMVALRAPDELFALSEPFSAAPDIGWPDLFNTGLLVLNPNMGDYYALLAMAQRGISFDGADQGLLNMHFKNGFNRLSFAYNVTPSAHYQYIPAYRHFQSSISLVHFIGPEKPWTQGRDASYGSGPFDELLGRWWAVYDRHYRASYSGQGESTLQIVRQHVKGEDTSPSHSLSSASYPQTTTEKTQAKETDNKTQETETKEFPVKQESSEPEYNSWDPTKTPPPVTSRGEASNLPSTRYAMSKDTTPFIAPSSYPKPPNNLHYEVPKTPTYQKPAPIFPWEKSAPVASRVFPEDEQVSKSSASQKTGGDTKSPSFQRGNAWDDIPEIERYIGSLQKNRKGNIQVLQGYSSELERPSLPVTPAPMRRPSFWGTERDEAGELPAAEGVPSQEEWDPAAQLEMLARRQSDVLANKLNAVALKEIPNRPLPFGSEPIKPPPQTQESSSPTHQTNPQGNQVEKPSFNGPGASWEKDETLPAQTTPLGASEDEKDVLEY